MSDIYSDRIYVQIKSPCKKRFPSPLSTKYSNKILCLTYTLIRTSQNLLTLKLGLYTIYYSLASSVLQLPIMIYQRYRISHWCE